MNEGQVWAPWANSPAPEAELPVGAAAKLNAFQRLLLIQVTASTQHLPKQYTPAGTGSFRQSVSSLVLEHELLSWLLLLSTLQQTQRHCCCSHFPAEQAACTMQVFGQTSCPEQLRSPLWYAHNDDVVGAMQAVRPDRLTTAMTSFVCSTLGLTSISPPSLSIATVLRQEATAGASHIIITPHLLHHHPTSSFTTHHYQALPLLQLLQLLLFPFDSSMSLLPPGKLDNQCGNVIRPTAFGSCAVLLHIACKDGACIKDASPVRWAHLAVVLS